MKCVMNKLIKSSNIYLFAFILSKSFVVFANDEPSPDIPEGIVKISKINPDRNVGYLMGDILNRTITLNGNAARNLITGTSQWFNAPVGTSQFYFSATGTTAGAGATITYYNAYI